VNANEPMVAAPTPSSKRAGARLRDEKWRGKLKILRDVLRATVAARLEKTARGILPTLSALQKDGQGRIAFKMPRAYLGARSK
jgi:hypothetical protein